MSARRALRTDRPRLKAVGGSAHPRPAISDEEIIEAVQQGDDRVAAELYDRLVQVVDHTIYRVFGRRERDHDDLVQAAFEQIVITICKESFAQACSLRTWASTIASHVALNALRSRRRERRVLDNTTDTEDGSIPPPSAPPLEAQLEVRSELERIREHLVAMKPKQAEALFLHDVLGHELAEIAAMTDTSVAAAQSRLVRGRHELHKRLGIEPPSRKAREAKP